MVLRQEEWCTASWQKPPVSSASEAKLPNWRAQELLQREGWALLHSGSNSCWGGRHRTERTFQVVLLCSYSSSVPVRPLEAKGDGSRAQVLATHSKDPHRVSRFLPNAGCHRHWVNQKIKYTSVFCFLSVLLYFTDEISILKREWSKKGWLCVCWKIKV